MKWKGFDLRSGWAHDNRRMSVLATTWPRKVEMLYEGGAISWVAH